MDIIDFMYWRNINAIAPDSPNRSDLRWDNYDNIMSGGTCVLNSTPVSCYDNFQEKNAWLQTLSAITSYDSKIIAYYGYIDPYNDSNNTDPNRSWLINQINNPLFNKYDTLLQYGCGSLDPFNCVAGDHQKALVANILISEGMNNYFLFNDGLVSTDSGRFSGHTLANRHQFVGYDHADMKDGKLVNGSIPLFDSVKNDLIAIWNETHGTLTGTVKDQNTSIAITGATVQIYGPNSSTLRDTKTTDSSGNFSFSDLEQGDYYLKIAKSGYSLKFTDFYTVSAGAPNYTGTIYLIPSIGIPPAPTLVAPGFGSEPGEEINTTTPTFQWNSVTGGHCPFL